MVLELTLVSVSTPSAIVGKLIERKRYSIENDSDFIKNVISFLADNSDVLSATVPDKAFVGKLLNLTSLSIDQFASLNYLLSRYGLYIFSWVIPESSSSETLKDGSFEYNVVDTFMRGTDFLNVCTKIVATEENLNIAEIFSKIYKSFELFSNSEDKLFSEKTEDPLLNLVQAAKDVQGPIGSVSPYISSEFYQICNLVGKKIYVVQS